MQLTPFLVTGWRKTPQIGGFIYFPMSEMGEVSQPDGRSGFEPKSSFPLKADRGMEKFLPPKLRAAQLLDLVSTAELFSEYSRAIEIGGTQSEYSWVRLMNDAGVHLLEWTGDTMEKGGELKFYEENEWQKQSMQPLINFFNGKDSYSSILKVKDKGEEWKKEDKNYSFL